MIFVSEKPIFDNYRPIPIGSDVSIIETKYVRFNPNTFKEEVLECDEDHFRKCTLVANEGDRFTVKIHNNKEIISFRDSPREFFFRRNIE